jgi:hypothetical protein
MCEIVEKIIKEEMLNLARESIAEGELTLEQIAKAFKLPLSEVQKLAEEVKARSETE